MTEGIQRGEFGLIGYPVGHSLSPAIFQGAFREAGIEARYTVLPVSPSRLKKTVSALFARPVGGINVTVPHKTAIIPLLDGLETSALDVGAVNTVAVHGGISTGYNTDLTGFENSLTSLGVPELSGRSVLVLGAGGAARAVVVSVARKGAARVLIANRTHSKAVDLARSLAPRFPGVRLIPIPSDADNLARYLAGISLCVQATSLGLRPEDPLPVEPSLIPAGCYVYDLVYGPDDTAFVRKAATLGLTASDGREMLLRQAAGAFEIWFGREAPVAAMRESLDRAIRSGASGCSGGVPGA